MLRPLVLLLVLVALCAAVWLLTGGPDESGSEKAPSPSHPREEPPAETADGTTAPSDTRSSPEDAAADSDRSVSPIRGAATGSSTKPTVIPVDSLPFESTRADGFVKIGFDDQGRVEVEAECGAARVFTFDVFATLDGKLEWLAGNDGVADLRANLELGNRKYLTERHWSRLRASLTHPRHTVPSGAAIEVRITYFDLEGRKLEEERYRLSAP